MVADLDRYLDFDISTQPSVSWTKCYANLLLIQAVMITHDSLFSIKTMQGFDYIKALR